MSENNNTVSILLPTFNEERDIEACLNAINNNNYDMSLIHLIIIDGGSNDKTLTIIDSIKDSCKFKLSVLLRPKTTVYEALNIGIESASGKYIMRVDARSFIPQNYISKSIDNLTKMNADVVGGVQLQFGKTIWQRTIAEALQTKFGTGGAKYRTTGFSGFVDTVYLGVFEKKIFDKVGLFDDDGIVVSEDAMMNDRIRKAGGKIYLDGDLQVLYPAKTNLKALFKQYFIYGGAKAHVFSKYKRLTAIRQYAVLFSFISGLILFICTLFHIISPNILIYFISVYLLTSIFFSSKIKLSKGSCVSFTYCIIVFPTIHFSWATGFILRYTFGPKLSSFFFKSKKK